MGYWQNIKCQYPVFFISLQLHTFMKKSLIDGLWKITDCYGLLRTSTDSCLSGVRNRP